MLREKVDEWDWRLCRLDIRELEDPKGGSTDYKRLAGCTYQSSGPLGQLEC